MPTSGSHASIGAEGQSAVPELPGWKVPQRRTWGWGCRQEQGEFAGPTAGVQWAGIQVGRLQLRGQVSAAAGFELCRS